MESLALLLGAASPPECVRAPADMAIVEGTFWLDAQGSAALYGPLRAQGVPNRALPPCDAASQLEIRREVIEEESIGRVLSVRVAEGEKGRLDAIAI